MITIRNRRKSFIINKNSNSNRTFFHVLRIAVLPPGQDSAKRMSAFLIANFAIRTPRNSPESIHIHFSNSELSPLFVSANFSPLPARVFPRSRTALAASFMEANRHIPLLEFGLTP